MKRLAALLLALAAPLAAAGDTAPPVAYFSSSSASLTADTYDLLRAVATDLKAHPGRRLLVAGHSDASGPAGPNQVLSQRRAEAVRAYLITQGIAPGRLVAQGYGATQPVNDNATLEKRAWNRRVEFRPLN